MGELSGIEWTDHTFNPWIGCEKVSPGCAHCYAETLVQGRMGRGGTWGENGVRERTSASTWKQPLRWHRNAARFEAEHGRRQRVFCASLADVFEPRPELEPWRHELFFMVEQTPSLDWLILTKRPEHARDWFASNDMPLGNVWLGTSIENSRHTYRADVLRTIPAAVRFLSCEPLLGSLFTYPGYDECNCLVPAFEGHGQHSPGCSIHRSTKKPLDLSGINWVIVGGESGPGARPFDVAWAREIVVACRAAGAAPFVKQLGSRPIISYEVDGHPCSASVFGIRDRKGGKWEEWEAKVPDLRVREFPARQGVLA